MNGGRKSIDFGDLDEFVTRPKTPLSKDNQLKAIDNEAAFPSREREDEAQMNIKAPSLVLNRFRQLARKERYKHGEFLEILMNSYENK